MKDEESPEEATADAGAIPVALPSTPKQLSSDRSFLKPVRRALTERELATVAAQNFLLDDIDRLHRELQEARQHRDECLHKSNDWQERFYIQNASLQVLEERTKKSSALELVYNISIIVGSALIGLSPGMLTVSGSGSAQMHIHGWIILAFGTFLIAASVGARFLQTIWAKPLAGKR